MAEIIRINGDTWRVEDGGVRFFVLEGTEKAAVIDTGMTTKNAREIASGITERPLVLINTHADPDHVAGNAGFDTAFMSPAETDNYRAHGQTGDISPLKEGDTIDLGGRVLRVIDIPGHTPGSIALLDVERRVLYSGDSVQDSNIFMFGERRDLRAYVESLRHLRTFTDTFDDIYPAHGTLPVGKALIDQLTEGAEMILAGASEGRVIDLFGKPVCLHKFPYAGFLCAVKD